MVPPVAPFLRRVRAPALLVGLLLAALMARPARAQQMPPWGTGESRPEDLTVSLVVFGPGSDIPSWWGHAALGVEDRAAGEARLYNYGMFDFRKFAAFALGRLEFWVDDAPVTPYLRLYRSEDRDVRIVRLNLDPEGRAKLASHLAHNVLPENRDYLYDHYKDNCSSRLRDGIDLATGGQFKQALSAPGRMTLRELTRRYTSVDPFVSVVLDFGMNDTIDRPITMWDEAFLPDELERSIASTSYVNAKGEKVPLLAGTTVYHRSQSRTPTPELPPDYTPWLLAIGAGWGALALVWSVLAKKGPTAGRVLLGLHTALTGLVPGLFGTVLLLMWLFTNHTVTFHNENLFLANPLTLAALPLGLSLARGRNPRTRERLRRLWLALGGLALLGLLLKVLPMFDQNNWNILALLLPTTLGLAGAHARLAARAAAEPRGAASLT